MGRVTKQKARKDWRCGKCGTVIKKGEEYYALHINYHVVRRRCLKCGFRNWELSSSYYDQAIGQVRESLQHMGDNHRLTETELSDIEEKLGDLGNRLERGIEGMPDNLMESAPVQERQDRLDVLDDILDNFPDVEDEPTAEDIMEYLKQL